MRSKHDDDEDEPEIGGGGGVIDLPEEIRDGVNSFRAWLATVIQDEELVFAVWVGALAMLHDLYDNEGIGDLDGIMVRHYAGYIARLTETTDGLEERQRLLLLMPMELFQQFRFSQQNNQ